MNIKQTFINEAFAKILFSISVIMVTVMLSIAAMEHVVYCIVSLQMENESLRNLTKYQENEINDLRTKIDSIQNVSPKNAIIECESDPKLMSKFHKLLKLDRGINHEYAKASLFYISQHARDNDLDFDMVVSVAFVESRFANLIGNGDYGIMQINFKTWADKLDVTLPELIDLENNIEIGCYILRYYKNLVGEDYIRRYNGIGPETIAYQQRVLKVYYKLKT